mmetsp:Transcript_30039/g.63817  ORF Transcript_30039/g.63817 Transcript_30039/m.63817 type:complete len:281 (+) Transcript_30039:105-947(+)
MSTYRRSSRACFLTCLLYLTAASFFLLADTSNAYPIITDVGEADVKCFNFNVPDDDDAHMVFIALPDNVDDEVEEWFNTQMNEMTRKGSNNFMKSLPQVSKEIHDKISGDEYNGRSNVYLKLTVPKRPVLRHQMFMWYAPVVVMNVVKAAQRGNNKKKGPPPGGYSICFENKNSDQEVKIIFDVVLMSDEGQEDEMHRKIIKKEHLTPLEQNFQEGIKAANTILNEMKYMEKREARMRHTAESTNSKIRLFSYISVIVLLGVTWLQRTYLKSYFKKKKLM